MVGAFMTPGEMKNAFRIFLVIVKVVEQSEDLVVYDRVILK